MHLEGHESKNWEDPKASPYMTTTERFFKGKTEIVGKFAYSILVGVFGTILLVLFLSTLMNMLDVVKFIPWVMGFNTATTGYCLVEKTRDQLRYRQVSSIVAGILNVLLTCIILHLVSFHLLGGYFFDTRDFIIFLIIGIICSEFGALLAIKYFKLKG